MRGGEPDEVRGGGDCTSSGISSTAVRSGSCDLCEAVAAPVCSTYLRRRGGREERVREEERREEEEAEGSSAYHPAFMQKWRFSTRL